MSTTTSLANKQYPGTHQQAQLVTQSQKPPQHHPQPQQQQQQQQKNQQNTQQQIQNQIQHRSKLLQSNIPSAATNLKNSINLQQHQPLPPRYQPPPQIPNGGILKHLSGSGNQTKSSVPTLIYPSELNPHLNLKYPPDIPKLSQIHIPDNIKSQSRLIQPQRTRFSTGNIPVPSQNSVQTNGNHRPLQRLPSSSVNSSASEEEQHLQKQQQQQQHQQEMLKFVRKPDTDSASSTSNSTTATNGTSNVPNGMRMPMDQNRQLQSLIAELRALKEANARLSDDNQELRDLCCFLDDDRQKGRKLAREWQRFGRYTASVMRQEVSAYQNKLRQLDDKQQELIRDNLELKELCLYLDEERTNSRANALCASCGANCSGVPLRDDGDGSSSSTNADEPLTNMNRYTNGLSDLNIRPSLSDQTLQYVRSLENRIRELEEGRATQGTTNGTDRPEAVVRALQVLEVREQLERERIGGNTVNQEQLDDGEKALVREMCNVVWRKLEQENTAIDHM